MKKILLLSIIALALLTAAAYAAPGDIEVSAKIVPINDSFIGLIDAKQVIGGLDNTVPPTAISTFDVWQHLGATAPLIFDAATGKYSIPRATSEIDGYLSHEDFVTFNGGGNAAYLKLDQTTPQTIIGGAPTFNTGLISKGSITTEDLKLNARIVYSPSDIANIGSNGLTSVTKTLIRVQGASAGITDVTAAIPIAAGSEDGQMLILRGTSDINLVKFNGGSHLNLDGRVSFTLGDKDTLTLIYDKTNDYWYETGRSDN